MKLSEAGKPVEDMKMLKGQKAEGSVSLLVLDGTHLHSVPRKSPITGHKSVSIQQLPSANLVTTGDFSNDPSRAEKREAWAGSRSAKQAAILGHRSN
ncbi:hypothetical protein E4U42_005831 [Claviceps africana]|uniref:Uncharacterized protein n=1 Tax=Claviceps africana TaxID=83212 RepID=A0A8K0J3Q9_9HYPO|nr:hypothetical protein E4U42_005831 [Claviceps africana]